MLSAGDFLLLTLFITWFILLSLPRRIYRKILGDSFFEDLKSLGQNLVKKIPAPILNWASFTGLAVLAQLVLVLSFLGALLFTILIPGAAIALPIVGGVFVVLLAIRVAGWLGDKIPSVGTTTLLFAGIIAPSFFMPTREWRGSYAILAVFLLCPAVAFLLRLEKPWPVTGRGNVSGSDSTTDSTLPEKPHPHKPRGGIIF